MSSVLFKDRLVILAVISYGDDPVDTFVEDAYYSDSEIDLTEEELVQLTDEIQDVLYDEWLQHEIGTAESIADKDR